MQKIDVNIEKIDDFFLGAYGMVNAIFQIFNKLVSLRFF